MKCARHITLRDNPDKPAGIVRVNDWYPINLVLLHELHGALEGSLRKDRGRLLAHDVLGGERGWRLGSLTLLLLLL